MLAMLLSVLLTPAGTIIAGAAVTSLLVGGLVVGSPLDAPAGATHRHSTTPKPRSAKPAGGAGEPYVIPIEHGGEALLVALGENMPGADPDPTGFEPERRRLTTPEETGGTPGLGATPPAAPQQPVDPQPRQPRQPRGPVGPADPLGPRQWSPTLPPPPIDRPGPVKLAPEPRVPDEPPAPPAPLPPSGSPTEALPREAGAPTLAANEPPARRSAPRHAVDEPAVWGLVLLGGAALAIARRRRSPPARAA